MYVKNDIFIVKFLEINRFINKRRIIKRKLKY